MPATEDIYLSEGFCQLPDTSILPNMWHLCILCAQPFSLQSDPLKLVKHYTDHYKNATKQRLSCGLCALPDGRKLGFRNVELYFKHLRVHFNACFFCGQTDWSVFGLINHLVTHINQAMGTSKAISGKNYIAYPI